MTERLYYTDAWLTAFTATVTDTADDGRRVYLDRTAFYPTSGGQAHDTGTLDGHAVVDVIDEGDRIAHILADPIGAATRVEGRIDWTRRFHHMQQHTGQHLLSAVLDAQLGARTVSVHFGDEINTLDLDRGDITDDALAAAEHRANEIILENRPVTITFEEADEAEGLRKAPKRAGTLRIIGILDTDRSACGGTHVDRTGQIGVLRVPGQERVRKQVRVRFVCGWRALAIDRRNTSIVEAASRALSAAPPEVPDAIAALSDQLRDARFELRKASAELAEARAARLVAGAAPSDEGIVRVTLADSAWSAEELRALAQAMSAHASVRFVASTAEPPMVFVAAGESSGWHAGNLLKSVIEKVGGRGGGSPRAAQGTVPSRDTLSAVLAELAGA